MVFYFYKKLTLTAKLNKNGKKTLKVQFFFSRKVKFLWRLNCLFWNRNVKKQQTDKEGRILILDVPINDSEYILINLYNANTENEQIDVLSSWKSLI